MNDFSYRDYLTTGETSSKGTNYNAVFTDKKDKSVSVSDFLNLMVAQLKNQDFMNPVDDTQYVAQLAQFATMQQMQELAEYSKSNYVMSLVGKNVTAAKFTVGGQLTKETGAVQKISLVDNEYHVYINGKSFSLEQIMEINGATSAGGSGVDVSKFAVSAKDVTDTSVTLEWPAPTTTQTLKYSAYYSKNPNLSSVDEVEANGILIGAPNRTGLTSESIKGLKEGTTYFVNVVVTDESGNKSVYQKAVFTTLDGSREE